MKLLELLTTEGCHLCELAIPVLSTGIDPKRFNVDLVDIAYDDQLLDCYGTRIPVLRDPNTGAELEWPFDQKSLVQFISAL